MAAVVPTFQKFVDLPDGSQLSITKVRLVSASDTFTAPVGANSTANASIAGVRPAGQASCTVTQSSFTVTCAGTAGNDIIVVNLHPNKVNSQAEA